MKTIFLRIMFFAIMLLFATSAYSQTRIAVLPFQNMDGPLEYSKWCFQLQDSVAKLLKQQDPDENYFRIVPIDSIEALTAEMNLDPSNPQYETDVWKAVHNLNAKYVVSGFFIVDGSRVVISAYIYDAEFKLPDPNYQAKDIRKKKEKIMEVPEIIVEQLYPGIIFFSRKNQ